MSGDTGDLSFVWGVLASIAGLGAGAFLCVVWIHFRRKRHANRSRKRAAKIHRI